MNTPTLEKIDHADALSAHRFRYFDFAMAATCVIVVCSDIIGAGKVASFSIPLPFMSDKLPFTFGAGVLFFPLSYVLGDVLTEVYGYARARRVIWAAFAADAFAASMAAFITAMPPSPEWNVDLGGISRQAAFALDFGQTPRIVFASVLALWAGEIANAYVMARMKVWTAGKFLWARTIGSTIVGEGVDSLIFYPVAFIGVWKPHLVLIVMATNYALKVLWETVLTPVTYKIVGFLKRVEGVDVYDKETDFTPFSVKS
ncbi:MAG TPA: queuosine precursor transporter [Parvularculaceae bacterium]|nr:queuosine precursor transporter [Parvularculaceae bacterium]